MPDEVKLLPCEDKCAICGKLKMQHTMNCGVGMCQIYPTFVSERAMAERLSRALEATRPTLVTDEVVERVLTKAEAQIDENERAMIEERTGQYGTLKPDQLIAIKGLHQQQRNGVNLVRAAIAAMPTIVQDGGWQTIATAPSHVQLLVSYYDDTLCRRFFGLAYAGNYEDEGEGIRATHWKLAGAHPPPQPEREGA